MSKILGRRPSPALAVAMAALVAALGGTALAGPDLHGAKKKKVKVKKQAGDKIIKTRSLSGDRLKLKALTGAEVDVAKLGTVPSATHAGNADTVGGKGPGDFTPAGTIVTSNGLVKLTAATPGSTAVVVKRGPFTLSETCTKMSGTTVEHDITISSTESGSRAAFGSGGTGALTPVTTMATTGSLSTVTGYGWGGIAPSGAAVNGELNIVEKGFGADCAVSAFASG